MTDLKKRPSEGPPFRFRGLGRNGAGLQAVHWTGKTPVPHKVPYESISILLQQTQARATRLLAAMAAPCEMHPSRLWRRAWNDATLRSSVRRTRRRQPAVVRAVRYANVFGLTTWDWRPRLTHNSLQNACWGFCAGILPDVSRSFALIIPQCPEPLDRAMCVAYLICRLADTVEDEAALTDEQRALLYDILLAAVDAPDEPALAEEFRRRWPAIPADEYGRLVEGTPLVLAAYATLPAELRGPIRTCVHDMIGGMRSMGVVEYRNGVGFVCRDMADLERYCHHVAGTVGIMSTALFEERLRQGGFAADAEWREDGRRLGLGLQMTNIIKDCRVDAERKVSFIPADFVDWAGSAYRLAPRRKAELFGCCIGHLDAGLRYTLAVPTAESGIRIFLLGSLLPAIATLEVAAPGTETHPRIDRAKMGEIVALITSQTAENQALRNWYTAHRKRTLNLLFA